MHFQLCIKKKKRKGTQLILERDASWRSHASIECSSSTFRKLGTPLAETISQSRFSRRHFCLRVPSIKEKKKRKKKKIHSWTARSHRVFHGYSRPPRSLSISKFNAWDERGVARKVCDLLASGVFFFPFSFHHIQIFQIFFTSTWKLFSTGCTYLFMKYILISEYFYTFG